MPAHNRGFVLPVALILLFVSTLVGVTALRVNSLSEKMAVNALQREEAFARAEAALLEGELFVRDNAEDVATAIVGIANADVCAATTGDGSTGLCSPASHPQDPGNAPSTTERWETIFFGASISPNVRTTPDGTPYIIEFMGHIVRNSPTENNISSCAPTIVTTWPYCTNDSLQFRITTMATSGTEENSGLVMLQSVYVAL